MAATPIGTNAITSIARQYIMPTVTDNIYRSNVLLYRLLRMNKRIVRGGTQIEVPLLYKRFSSGGAYSGFEQFAVAPQDTIKTAAFNWKQYQVTWAVDGLTMIKVDSPDAIANFLVLQSQQAYMEMAENLAGGLFADASLLPKEIDGFSGLFGSGSTVGDNTYGGITRTSNTWWNSSVTGTTSTSTLSQSALQTAFSTATIGGQHPTLILSRSDQYNRWYALNGPTSGNPVIQYNREPMGHDELLASAGFTNLLFNNVPWVVDSHVDDGIVASNSAVYMVNENFLAFCVSPRADFYLKPFQEPVDQDAMVASILYAGNLVCMNCSVQGGILNVNA